jgi:uncharacterized protein YhaN
VTSIRVDGFGVLAGVSIDAIPEGLTVFFGENEVGKTTLLDFLRGALFGFPDRRHRAPFHAPIRGGRHGGGLGLIDDSGVEYLLERFVDDRSPTLALANGAHCDPGELSTILGGADDALFRSVFAFGLSELSSFESLDRDEIRDLVFSAGVLGAGRSATRAIKLIAARRAALVRQRRGDAVANSLRHELDEIDSELRQARRAAIDLPSRLRERDTLSGALDEATRASSEVARRRRQLDQLQIAWPLSRRRDAAIAALKERADPHGGDLLQLAETFERLAHNRSGRIERIRRCDELREQLLGRELEIDLARRALGLPSDHAFVAVDAGHEATAQRIADGAAEIAAQRRTLEDQRASAANAVARSVAQRDGFPTQPRSVDELRGASLAAAELRSLLRERDRDEQRLAPGSGRHGGHGRSRVAQAGIVAMVIVAIAALVVDASGRKLPAVLVGAGALAVVLFAAVVTRFVIRGAALSTASGRSSSPAAARREREIERIAAALGLVGEPTEAAVDSCSSRLDDERDQRRALDTIEETVRVDRLRLDEVDRAISELGARAASFDEQAEKVALVAGLRGTITPASLVAAISSVKRAASLCATRDRIEAEIAAIEEGVLEERSAILRSCALVGLSPRDGGDAEALLDLVLGAVGRARADAVERADLERTIRETTADLESAIGSGPSASELLAELSSGDLLGWAEELAMLEASAVTLDATRDQALDALRECERELDDLERSAEVATLEVRRGSTAAMLERALAEWAELGLAEALLGETLARYERERQPEVIALAGSLFGEVTSGRYVALVPREDADGARHRGIDVIARNGSRIAASDLSRGTAEQLYLCLRLGFATTFAERAVTLPLVLDDVLVNFDPGRARAMAGAIARTASSHQVLAFTCHPHIVEHFTATGDVRVVTLDRPSGSDHDRSL